MKQKHNNHLIKISSTCFIISCLVSCLIYEILSNSIEEKEEIIRRNIENEVSDGIYSAMNKFTYGLGGANGVFVSNKTVGYEAFSDYVRSRNMQSEFPGSTGFGFIQYVKRLDLNKFIEDTKNDLQPNFSVSTSGNNPDLFIIKYFEPSENKEAIIGYDIGSESTLRSSAELATITGQPVLSKKVGFFKNLQNQSEFLYLKPVYKKDASLDTEEKRKSNIYGWVYTIINLEATLKKVIEKYDYVSFEVYEGADLNPNTLIFKKKSNQTSEKQVIIPFKFAQQNWSLKIFVYTKYLAQDLDYYLPLISLILGMFVGLLGSVLIYYYLSLNYRRLNDLVREGENLLQGVLDSANFSIIVTDLNGTIKLFNNGASKLLGYSPEEVIGKFTPEMIHDQNEIINQAKVLSDLFGRTIEPGFEVFIAKTKLNLPDENEWTYIRKDGSRVPVDLSITSIRNDNGVIYAYMGIAQDISEQRTSSQDLKNTKNLLATLIDNLPVGIFLKDGRPEHFGTMRVWNKACEKIFGISSDEILNMLDIHFFPKEQIEDFHRKDHEVFNSRKSLEVEEEADSRILGKRILRTVKLPFFDSVGKPEYLLGFCQDITEQKHLENSLLKKEKLFRQFIEDSPAAIAMFDEKLRYLVVSNKWIKEYGLEGQNIIGKSHYDVFPDLPQEYKDAYTKILKGEVPLISDEDCFERASGHKMWIKWAVQPWHNEVDEISGLIMSTEVVTARKIAEAKIQEYNKALLNANEKLDNTVLKLADINSKLEQATNFKSQFLANMSHEIRTPLTSIIGYSESLLSDSFSKEEQASALNTVMKNGYHLLGVINDILDLSKIEAGKLTVEAMPVDIAELVSDVANLMQYKAKEKGLLMSFEYVYPIPKKIQTDPLRLKQILINLVGNSVKFTTAGEVKVIVSFNKESYQINFAVKDTGIGLSREQSEKLFKAFSQADTSTTRKFGGTGLGLVISNQLAQKLGGAIVMESELGKGSTFNLTISSGRVSEEDLVYEVSRMPSIEIKTDQNLVPGLKGKILIAEDGEDNQALISFLLKKTGAEFKIVNNGLLAVEEIQNQTFDLVLMDCQMPVMDGYTATKTIRDKGFEMPIIALTANALKEDVDRAYSMGSSDFLGKPFTRKEFYSKLINILGKNETPTTNSKVPIVSLNYGVMELLGEYPDMQELVSVLINKIPQRVKEIKELLINKDWEGLSFKAHSLSGSAAAIRLIRLSEVARLVEDAADLQNEDQINIHYQSLFEEAEAVQKIDLLKQIEI